MNFYTDRFSAYPAVNLLCHECFYTAWARAFGVVGWTELRSSIIEHELRPDCADAEIHANTIEEAWEKALHGDMEGIVCPHIEARFSR